MTLERLLMSMGEHGHVTTNFPLAQKLTTPTNLRRLKGLPIFLFSGTDNHVLAPESTLTTYETLRDMFGGDDYERVVIDGYGHLDCWMGTRADRDVYPLIAERVERVCRGKGNIEA